MVVVKKVKNKYYDPNKRNTEELWINELFDVDRSFECLCMNCERVEEKSCSVASKLYEICVSNDISLGVSKCGVVDENGDLMYKPTKGTMVRMVDLCIKPQKKL
jgi:uncharacterized radical SAM superfamily Fe-S cluster-containing enzyme